MTSGQVSLKDSSEPAREKIEAVESAGSFAIDTSALTPPFLLKADVVTASGASRLFAFSPVGGPTDIDELTNAAVIAAAAGSGGGEDVYAQGDAQTFRRMAGIWQSFFAELRVVLKPLFDLYQVPADILTPNGLDPALKALLRDVAFRIVRGNLVVTNRATGGVIFTGPLNDLAAGTFHADQMPPGPGGHTPDPCSYVYSAFGPCNPDGTQTRTVTSSSPAGCTGTPVLTQSCTYTPPPPSPCSYTYSAWGACQPNGTQSRTVTASSPAACTGTPVLTQSCTYTPPPPSPCSYTYSAWGACQPNGTQSRTVTSSSPAGCTGTPVLTQSCTYTPPPPPACTYTYSPWGACQPNGTQSRTVTSSSPAGCTGTPVLTQSCTYTPPPPPACTYAYSAWGACQPNGTQSRTVTSSSPAGCTGTPVLTQSCTYTPPPPSPCSYTYSSWGACQSNGTQSRTVTASSPAGCTGTPSLTQTCSPGTTSIRQIYPTVSGGREWFLPATADVSDSEWRPESGTVTKVSPGVFQTSGSGGQVRMSISSPAGKAWWRNVEMTGYVRYVGDQPLNGQQRHWEWFARGERHTANSVTGSSINNGVPAPAGTPTWPWYPMSGSVNPHCLGTAYHGNFYALTGRALFEKEITHTAGYASQAATQYATFSNPLNRWVGIKFILRNNAANTQVHMELWLDVDANGNWTKVTENVDTGNWSASGSLDGCNAAPYNYANNQLMTWASPWVTFRSDAITMEFKSLSVREIAPAP